MKYFVVFLCIFNVVMWIVFLRLFRKLFTTENIIEDTKAEYNKLVTDFNKNTKLNITVIDDRIRQMKALIAEADKKIRLLTEAETKSVAARNLQSAVSAASGNSGAGSGSAVRSPRKKAQDAYTRNKTSQGFDSNSSFELTGEGVKEVSMGKQNMLFDDEEPSPSIDTKATVNVTSHGDSWAEIPVVTPNVYVSDKPIVPKKDKKSRIVELFDSGYSIEEISSELKLTDTEVQFALSLENRI